MAREVTVGSYELSRLSEIGDEAFAKEAAEFFPKMAAALAGRTVWNVNSTAEGGGVAEMLRNQLAYLRGAGVDIRWLVIDGVPEFFQLTKRLHNTLHGSDTDDRPFNDDDIRVYEQTLESNIETIDGRIKPTDFVILHDPQTAGLIPNFKSCGNLVVWRCHVGADVHDRTTHKAWAFLKKYLTLADALVFSREQYVPDDLNDARRYVIPPSIDPLSAKNQPMDPETVLSILIEIGLLEGPPPGGNVTFRKLNGSVGRVEHSADVIRLGRAPSPGAHMVTQVSRWDRLKDPVGVLHGFAKSLPRLRGANAQLVLAGPNVNAVADDPEGAEVFNEVVAAWRTFPHAVRKRMHLANLPMKDVEENAAIVNALQRHSTVIVQKSLKEGFGLTVTEAMWKASTVIASSVGGIRDQIEDGHSGLLLADPESQEEFADRLADVFHDPEWAMELGRNARDRVRANYLPLRHFRQYLEILKDMT